MDWIRMVAASGVVSSALLGTLVFLSRNVILERLKNSVRYEFDVKLEKVRADIRAGEEHLNAVRSTALAALSSGQQALNERRLKAIDDVWDATTSLGRFTVAVHVVAKLNLKEIVKTASDPIVGTFIDGLQKMGGTLEQFNEQTRSALSARPFVTPMAWALYKAYFSVVSLAVAQLAALKLVATLPPNTKLRQRDDESVPFLKSEPIIELVKTLVPERAKQLDERGVRAFPEIVVELEERLIAELRAGTEGRETDPQDAARFKKLADLVRQQDDERAEAALKLQKIPAIPD